MILNEDGCAMDKFILNNLEYPQDLIAGQEVSVILVINYRNNFFLNGYAVSVATNLFKFQLVYWKK